MATVGILPARLASTRLPGKLLLAETGKPLLQHTWEAACRATSLSEVVIATDSEQIAETVRDFGGRVEMTGDHPSGTDRVAEVVARCCQDSQFVVNIQGDEPEINPSQIDLLVKTLRDSDAEMATLATPLLEMEQLADPSCVKVVCTSDGRALYFSRSTIPYCRDGNVAEEMAQSSPWKLHLGIYAYRREFLLQLTQMPPSALEQLEKLEQLRALESGAGIQVAVVDHCAVGIDTRQDYVEFVRRQAQRDSSMDNSRR